jgi:hypothetical protein
VGGGAVGVGCVGGGGWGQDAQTVS